MKGKKALALAVCAALLQGCGLAWAETAGSIQLEEPTLVAEIPLHGIATNVTVYDDGAFLLTGSQTNLTASFSEASPATVLRINEKGETQWRFDFLMHEQAIVSFNEGFALGENTYALMLTGADSTQGYSQLLLVKDQEVVKREELPWDWIHQLEQVGDRLLRFSRPQGALYEEEMTNRELFCYDQELNLLWQAEYDLPIFLADVLPLEEGYLLFGRLQEPDETGLGPSQGFVGKVDANGVLETYQTVEDDRLQYTHAIRTEDGGYLALGACENASGRRLVHMTFFDQALNVTGTKHVTLEEDRWWNASDIVPVAGGFVVAYASEPDSKHMALHAYDTAGNLTDSLSFPVDCKGLTVCSLRSNDYGIFLFVGALKPLEENHQQNRRWTLMYRLNGVP